MIHHAPAVVYPIGRSRFLGQLLFAVWFAGLSSLAGYIFTTQQLGWRFLIGFALVLVAGLAARLGWRNQPAGELRWDGAAWLWESGSYQTGVAEQQIVIIADFQSFILLRLKNSANASLWLWPEKRTFPARWLDLRRALYSTRKQPTSAPHDALPLAVDDLTSSALPSVSGSLFPTDSSKTEA